MKRILSVFGYAILYLLVLVGVGESYLYWRGFQIDRDSVRDYYKITKVWQTGMYRPERPLPLKVPKTAKEILVLGCSFSYGMGVEPEDTFCWKINEQQSDYHLTNCGIIGCGISTALLQLPTLLRQRHYDMVLFATIANHAYREWDMSMVLDSQPQNLRERGDLQYKFRTERPIYINGAMHQLLLFWCHKVWPGEDNWRFVSFAHKAWLNQTYPQPLDIVHNLTYSEERLRYGLRSCHTICQQQNIPFVVAELYGFNNCKSDPHNEGPYSLKPLEYFINTPFAPNDVPPPIPIIKAEYPLDYLDKEELHTIPSLNDAGDHPSALVHSYYARKILEGLRKLVLSTKQKPAVSVRAGSALAWQGKDGCTCARKPSLAK